MRGTGTSREVSPVFQKSTELGLRKAAVTHVTLGEVFTLSGLNLVLSNTQPLDKMIFRPLPTLIFYKSKTSCFPPFPTLDGPLPQGVWLDPDRPPPLMSSSGWPPGKIPLEGWVQATLKVGKEEAAGQTSGEMKPSSSVLAAPQGRA